MGSKIALGVFALFMAIVLTLSDRPWTMTSMPRVREIVTLPDRPDLADVRRYTEFGSGILPYMSGQTVPTGEQRTALKLGWMYRETDLLRMPFFAVSEEGMVTYLETSRGVQVALVNRDQLALLDRALGTHYAEPYRFPWWEYLWGWTAALLLALWFFLYRREAERREDARWEAA